MSALVVTVPTWFFAVLQFKGQALGLLTPEGALTSLANKCFWGSFAFSCVYATFKSRADFTDRLRKKSGQDVLQTLLECTNNITIVNLNSCLEWIKKHPSGVTHICDVCQPHIQLKHMLDEVEIALSSLFGLPRGDIGLSILFLDSRDQWEFFCAKSIDNDLDIDSIIKKPNSTINYLITTCAHSVFFPDKRIGISENRYIPGARDRENDNVGSIICRDISVHSHKAILSITTYGKQLCDQDDIETKSKIETAIIPPFEVRIKLALAQCIIQKTAPHVMHGANLPAGRAPLAPSELPVNEF